MVYDFGGGTFDAAVMQIRHGQINVFNHAGDNKLGGKDLDWDIVTEILAPEVARRGSLSDFKRGVPRWAGAMGKLKWLAELAKIEVCRTGQPHEIYAESLYTRNGTSVDFTFTLLPDHVRKISEPYIVRSLRLCEQALAEKGLSGKDMAKIILVGGSTLNPFVRQRVAEALKAPLEFSIDSVTVVAQGAAIFASTKEIPEVARQRPPRGTWTAELVYDKTGGDLEPPIAGKVSPPSGSTQTPQGLTLEFVDVVSSWRSGRIYLDDNGEFQSSLRAEPGRRCEYLLELCDSRGTMLQVSPETCAYTHGVIVGPKSIIAPHTLAVGLADNRVHVFVPRGSALPLEETVDFKSTIIVRAGSSDTLRIPLLQGHSPRADRNLEVAALVLSGDDLIRTLPEGSNVEVRVHMDESQIVTVEAYFKQIDHMKEMKVELGRKSFTLEQLREMFDSQKRRLSEARNAAEKAPEIREVLAKIDAEDIVPQCERMLQAASADMGVRATLYERLMTLATMLDDVEQALAWPKRVKEAEVSRDEARRIARKYGTPEQKEALHNLEAELAPAIQSKDAPVLTTTIRQLDRYTFGVAYNSIVFLSQRLNALEADYQNNLLEEPAKAEQLIAQGRRASHNGDLELLRSSVLQLEDLTTTRGTSDLTGSIYKRSQVRE
jgi:molecular chaperone DnaK